MICERCGKKVPTKKGTLKNYEPIVFKWCDACWKEVEDMWEIERNEGFC